jgi:hypothetical protein
MLLVSLSLLYKMADITKEELRKEITGKLQNLCCGTILATENMQISFKNLYLIYLNYKTTPLYRKFRVFLSCSVMYLDFILCTFKWLHDAVLASR